MKTQFSRNLIMAAILATPTIAGAATVSEDQVVTHYADLAHNVFSDSLTTAQGLDKTIDAFIASPSQETLDKARVAWKAYRVNYQQSELYLLH